MSKYKLVPIQPTDEMIDVGDYARECGCSSGTIYTDMIIAAPDVQGEPAAITDADILTIAGRVESCPVPPWWLKDDVVIADVRAAMLRFARALLVAAPQPAPDASALAEALEQVIKADIKLPPLPKGDIAADTCPLMWVHTDQQTENYAREAIKADRQQRYKNRRPAWVKAAEAALAAYHNQGGEA